MSASTGLTAASFAGLDFEVNTFLIDGEWQTALLKGMGKVDYAVSESVLAGVRGTNFNRALARKRLIALELIYTAQNVGEYETKRDAIMAACNKENGEDTLGITLFGNDYILTAVPESPQVSSPDFPYFGALLQFVCYDPVIYAADETALAGIGVPNSGGLKFHIKFHIKFTTGTRTGRVSVNNQGNIETFPTLILNGPLTNPVIENEETGQFFGLDLTIGSGSSVLIDMKNRTVTRDGSNIGQYVSDGSEWWGLGRGTSSVRITTDSPSDTGSLEIRLRSTWGQL